MARGYLDLDIETDADALLDGVLAELEEAFPGWVPREGHLEVRLAAALMRRAAETREVTVRRARAIFDRFGEKVLDVPRGEATAASGRVAFTMVDDAGYQVPAGTVVAVRVTGDEVAAFVTDEALSVDPGETVGEVDVTAEETGEGGNGFGAGDTVEVVDSLAAVDAVALVETTGGGQDAEDEADYLDRLAARQRLSAPRPILPGDFAVLAREVPGVGRALAIDGYDPEEGTDGNERTVAVAAVDGDGLPVGEQTAAELAADLEARREVNFQVGVLEPTYTEIAVDAEVRAADGFTAGQAAADAEEAVRALLSPASWGGGDESPPQWRLRDTVRYLEVAARLSSPESVDFLDTLEVNGGTADVALSGRAPLPAPTAGDTPPGYEGPESTIQVAGQ